MYTILSIYNDTTTKGETGMNIFKGIKRLLCDHDYRYSTSHLVGVHLKCTKCGRIVIAQHFITKWKKTISRGG